LLVDLIFTNNNTCHYAIDIIRMSINKKIEHTNTESWHIDYLPVYEVILNHGYERDTSLLDNSEIDIERKESYFIASNAKGESSVPGLYAAGDILMHDGKLNLIAGAFQDAANAVNLAKQW